MNDIHNSNFMIERASLKDYDDILEVMRPWNMHHVPSPEMEELDLSCFFVARIGDSIVGASGYKVLSQTIGKTTLLGVIPEYARYGIGIELQHARIEAMYHVGVKRIITNADRPKTIKWYKKHFGYKEVGTLKKVCSFGDPDIDHWTTIEMDVEAYMKSIDRDTAVRQFIQRNEPHPLAPYPPLVINMCLTGMVSTKKQNRHIPITTDEIIEEAVKVYDAGARIVHIHARDKNGKPTWKASIYEKLLQGIRKERPDLICCVSTSGRHWSEFEKRSEVLELTGDAKPDMASLTLGSLNFPDGPSVNSNDTIERLAAKMRDKGIIPELEVFDPGMISMAKFLERKGIIEGHKYFNLILGNLGTIPATIGNLHTMVGALPENSFWTATGIGIFQLPMNMAAIIAGGGVRVGLEDSIYYDIAQHRLTSNEKLLGRIVRIGKELQRRVATPQETRRMIGLA